MQFAPDSAFTDPNAAREDPDPPDAAMDDHGDWGSVELACTG